MKGEGHVTTGRAARALGVTPNTVKSWIRRGKLRALRLPSGHYRVPIPELERLLEEGESRVSASPISRSQAWQEYRAWRQAQPAEDHRLTDVLAWVDSMLELARSRGPLPEPSAEGKAERVERLHRTLKHVAP
jgi:excisionase family DNA binding protein